MSADPLVIRFEATSAPGMRSAQRTYRRNPGAYRRLVAFVTARIAGSTQLDLETLIELPPRAGVDGDFPTIMVERLCEDKANRSTYYAATELQGTSLLFKVGSRKSYIEKFCSRRSILRTLRKLRRAGTGPSD